MKNKNNAMEVTSMNQSFSKFREWFAKCLMVIILSVFATTSYALDLTDYTNRADVASSAAQNETILNNNFDTALVTPNSATLTVRKTWVDATAGDEVDITSTSTIDLSTNATTGNNAIDNTVDFTSTATGVASQTDTTGSTTYEVFGGATQSFTEAFVTSVSNYKTTLACTGNNGALTYTEGSLTGSLVIDAADTAIVCTYTNTRIPVIDAINDDFTSTPINGTNGGTTASVVTADTLDGSPNPTIGTDVTLNTTLAQDGTTALGLPSGTAPASGSITMNAAGEIVIAPNTTPGTYTYSYEICDVANPTNCDIAVATVLVVAIDAVAETFPIVDGTAGGTTTSVLASDTLNGNPVAIADVDLTIVNTDPELTLDPATGLITVAPNTAPGTYTVEYQICDTANPSICDTVTETVTVGTIDAVAETFPIVDGTAGTTTLNALSSDTLNGNPVAIADVDLTIVNTDPELTLDPATGLITVAPNTAPGTYTVEYQICDSANPTICDTVTETVTVGTIDAVAETFPIVDGTAGGTTTSVLASDTLNGNPVAIADVDLTIVNTDPELTLDPATGLITVAPNTAPGTYTVEYQICDTANPSICDTVTETVTVGTIDAVAETFPIVDGTAGTTTLNALSSDTLNGNPVAIADVDLTIVNTDPELTLDPATGLITVAPNTAPGTYTVEYQICDSANPTICDTVTETVTVGTIDAVAETFPIVDGTAGGTTTSVLASDTLNGNPVAIADVDLTIVNTDPELTLDPATGLITVAPNTAPGTYTVEYQICDTANPSICDTVTETVTVGTIDAVAETFPIVDGTAGTTTLNALSSDTLNGNPVAIADVDLTIVNTDPELTLDPATGLITVAPNTAPGTYTVEYQICDSVNPTICDNVTETVTVGTIDAVAETFPIVDGTAGTTTLNALSSDTLNGNPVAIADVDLTIVNTDPELTLDPATGLITVAPNTAPGTYTVEYQICDTANPSICDTVTETVTVGMIDAVAETFPIVDGTAGGTTTSVLASDTLNGNPVAIADVDLTIVNTDPELTLDPATGLITVAPNTAPGTYTVEYQICDTANPSICDTVTETVTVGTIDAVAETFPIVDGTAGTTTLNALSSDTLNGNPVAIADVDLTIVNTDPELTLDPATGLITVAPNTAPGTYTVEYQICDSANPTICDTVTETVTVGTIDAVAETFPIVDGTAGGTTTSVLASDTLNGNPVAIADVDLTIVNTDPELTLDPATGLITVAPNTAPGTYTVEYQICDSANPTICDTVTETVTVGTIDAVAETFPIVDGTAGTTTLNALSSDTLNGNPVAIADVDLTIVNTDPELTLDPATGLITVAPNTAPGTYTVEYQICDSANPTICDTVTETVTVGTIDAVAETFPIVDGTAGGTTTSVLASDTLNGNPVAIADVDLTIVNTDPELTLDPATGLITVAPNTAPGTYTVEYQICDTANPSICDTVTETVTVGTIDAVAETFPIIDGTAGTTTLNALSSDTLNGNPVVIADVDLTIVNTDPELTLDPATGLITVAPNTAAGTYSVEYQICDSANPSICDTVTETVTVGTIDAVAETFPIIDGTAGTTTLNALSSDTLNGNPVAIADVDLTIVNTDPELTLDPATGLITVAPGTPDGTYTVEYQICDTANPSICDTVTETVTVGAIDALPETFPIVDGTAGGTTTSVLASDTLNGNPVAIADVDLTIVNTDPELTLDPATGLITVAPNTAPGTYTVEYQICDSANPTICDTVTETVTVGTIDAVAETFPIVDGTAGTTTLNALSSDTLNGNPVAIADVDLTIVNTDPELTLDPATGLITVAPNTAPGTYTVEYQICDSVNPTICDTVTETVTVGTIDAVAETFPIVDGTAGGTTTSVLASDTLNGNPVAIADVDLTIVNTDPELTLDPATGLITVAPNTAPGTYTVEYQICDSANPTICDTVTETVTVGTIDAVAETFPIVDGTAGGTTTSVLASDTLNGNPVAIADVDLTIVNTDPELTLDPATGLITVAPNTAAGTYTVEYQICDSANPSICDTVTETVTVGTIDAQPETFPVVDGTAGVTNLNALGSDTLNGNPVTIADVDLTIVSSDPELSLDPTTGLITVAPGTPDGTYTVEYQICDTANPSICDTVTETVTVGAIDALPETFPIVDGTAGGTTTSVLASDTLNGNPVAIADVDLTIVNTDPELTLDPATGLITVVPNTAPGTYTVEYQICDSANPTICDTVTETVTVGTIDAVAETFPIVDGTAGTTTLNALSSDTLNGNPVAIADVDLTIVNTDPELTLDPATGLITVAPNTAPGTYTVEYQICDSANPTICDTVTETVTVGTIDAVAETFPIVDGTAGTTTLNALSSDTLNGNPVTIADVDLTIVSSDPELSLDPATGLITVAPNTAPGTYTVEYQICDSANPTICDTVTETVTVGTIDAVAETFPIVDGTAGGTTTSVLASDTLNGNPVAIADVDLTIVNTDPELTLDPATGLITVAPNTAAGTYTVEYQICDSANPSICDTVTETVTVGTIDAQPETFPVVDGTAGVTNLNALGSDTLNGNPVAIADVDLTIVNTDPELTLDPATGLITVAPGTPDGTYTVEYQICDTANPSICDTVTETVTVGTIDAVAETFPIVDGTAGTTTLNALSSDTLNGNPVTIADVDLTIVSSDPELSLDPITGLITVAPGTPDGTYTVEYQICDSANPSICDTVTETVTVGTIDAQPETFPVVDGTAGVTNLNALGSDTLNGNPVTIADVDLTIVSSDPELSLDPTTGLITVAPGTPDGTYTVEYQICDSANPSICDTVTETVTVGAIDAQPETFPVVDGTAGVTNLNALGSDTLNGNPVTIADVDLTIVSSDPELSLDPATGLIIVAPNTAPGTYTVEYQICDSANPTICDTVTETVTVGTIDAQPETFPVVDGTAGVTNLNALGSDTLNGNPVTIADVDLTIVSSDPELSLDPTTGLITVAPGTPDGTYTVEYQICDTANPSICDTVTETVTVGTIDAQPETFPVVDGTAGVTNLNALGSDTLNGNPVTIADVDLTIVSSDPELSLDPTTGLITVAPGTPDGTYTVEYQICDTANPSICDTVTETVTVGTIDAQPETFPVVDGTAGVTNLNALGSDTLNGNPVTIADVDLTIVSSDPELSLDPATGLITVAPGTPDGTYTVEYQICDNANPSICDTVTETVTVGTIDAQPETFPVVDGTAGVTNLNALGSDTLNGNPVTIADVDLTIVSSDPELSLDPTTGLITVAPGTPDGTYTVEYQICDSANPSICDTVTETITVGAIDAVAETFPIVDGIAGTTTLNALSSDTLNGNPVTIADVDLTIVSSDPELSLDPTTGLITVAPGTPDGTYTVEYQICDSANPSICDTVTETVTVGTIDAQPETFPVVDGTAGVTNLNALGSDTLNGNPVTIADVDLTIVSSDPELSLDPTTGLITVAPGTPDGTYTVEYQICDSANPSICDTVIETVTVGAIGAQPETFPVVNGTTGVTNLNALGSDTLNGNPVTIADVDLTIVSSDPELSLDPATGLITVAPGTPAGIYTVEYQICDNSNPSICDTAIETINVDSAPIIAIPDTIVTIDGTTGGTGNINVLTNDTLNETPVDPVLVTLTVNDTVNDGVTINPNGSVSVAPGTPAGTYVIEYTICEILNPTNCSTTTATVPVIVNLPPVAVNDSSEPDQPLGQPVTVNIVSNDSDPEGSLDPTSVMIQDPSGNPVTTLVVDGEGTWTVDPVTGDITFTPETGFIGDPTPINYTVKDTSGLESNVATVTVDYEEPAAVTGVVWLDRDKDNTVDPDEDRKAGWTLKLKDADGNVIATTVTDSEGNYTFTGLIPAEYTIDFYNTNGVLIASQNTDGPLVSGQTVDLPLPVDPSGVVYDSTSRLVVEGVTLQLINSQGTPVDAACVGEGQQNQVTTEDGIYAFDVYPDAHSSCPNGETYTIRVVSAPTGYFTDSTIIPPQLGVYDSDGNEANCTLDVIANSGSCEVQGQPDAPQVNQDTTYFMDFTLNSGDSNVIFNHIPIDLEVARNTELDDNAVLLSKVANKKQISVGDQLYYTIRAENTTEDELDIDVRDDLPTGFKLLDKVVKLTRAGVDGRFGTDDDVTSTVNANGSDPVRFGPITLGDKEIVQIGYLIKVGTAAQQGGATNTAQVYGTGSDDDIGSNVATAAVQVVADSVLDQSSLVGKVFHDRDGDGYQDPANVTGITVKSDYFGWNSLHLGGLNGRVSVLDDPSKHRKIIRMPITKSLKFKVITQQGTVILVDNRGQVSTAHIGDKKKGLTGQDIRVTTRRTKGIPTQTPLRAMQVPAKQTDVLEISITNYGIHEEGIPGVRLVTVEGLLIETDGYGRYHIPDVDGGRRNAGKNLIIKVDTATLPRGSKITTENPRVIRITGNALNKINFGVRLPTEKQNVIRQDSSKAPVKSAPKVGGVNTNAVEVMLQDSFFIANQVTVKNPIAIDEIANAFKQNGGGVVMIKSGQDLRSKALGKARANVIRKLLHKRLTNMMGHVTVTTE